MGQLGSAVFFGLLVGSFAATPIFNNCSYKWIIVFSFITNGLSLYGFTMNRNFYCMYAARFIGGFSQIFVTIYNPLYIDVFAPLDKKPGLLSLILVSAPLGVVFGYGVTSAIILNKGVWSTDLQYFWT